MGSKLAMLALPGVNIIQVVDEEQCAESIPFQPRFKLSANRQTYAMGITIDPRIKFTDTGSGLFRQEVERQLYMTITRNDMLSAAMSMAKRLHWIHSHGELELVNIYPSLPKPTWQHDCDCCIFLGSIGEYRPLDMYFCKSLGVQTLICRFGSDGSQYKSGAPMVFYDDEIWAAGVLAESRGYLSLMDHHVMLIDDEVV